ncbi:hypothetical protein Slin14017_G074270 [Septoria linicola]|nr:hypothetical protein Slin14017_G074270 [Septoria linicola]
MDEDQEERPASPPTRLVSPEQADPPPPEQASPPPLKKPSTRRVTREWQWTDEMELDLLQFAWGKGTDMNDYYPKIVKRFAKVYNIQTTEHEIRKRFTRLRMIQKRLLTKYGRPLPPPLKYLPKNKKKAQKLESEPVKEQASDEEIESEEGDTASTPRIQRGRKRGAQEMEDDSVSHPTLSHQNNVHDTIPVDLFLAAARELEKREQANRP